MKQIRYLLETLALLILFCIFWVLPLNAASALGGHIARFIGPKMAASRKALKNINLAFPELDDEKKNDILKGMWANLGNLIAEYPHVKEIADKRVTIKNPHIAQNYIKKDQPLMIIGLHQANWEIAALSILNQLGFTMDVTYRAPNNPWVHKILLKMREREGKLRLYSKSKEGGRALMKALSDKRTVGVLIDQKYNEGIAVPFFGKPAMTNPVFVKLAQKYKYPLVPIQVERLENAEFIITFHEEVALFDNNGDALAAETVIGKTHELMENIIKKRPEQWLWLHRRWDSQKLDEMKENL